MKTAVAKKTVNYNNPETKMKNESFKFRILFEIKANAFKSEDNSGATISEWFDSGSDEFSLAKPFTWKKKGPGYEVIWKGNQFTNSDEDLVDDIFRNIQLWASVYDANFLSNSKISLFNHQNIFIKEYCF